MNDMNENSIQISIQTFFMNKRAECVQNIALSYPEFNPLLAMINSNNQRFHAEDRIDLDAVGEEAVKMSDIFNNSDVNNCEIGALYMMYTAFLTVLYNDKEGKMLKSDNVRYLIMRFDRADTIEPSIAKIFYLFSLWLYDYKNFRTRTFVRIRRIIDSL